METVEDRANFAAEGELPAYSIPNYQAPPLQTVQCIDVVESAHECKHCGGMLLNGFSNCGVMWAICCFPCGLICLLQDKEIQCSNCGVIQGPASSSPLSNLRTYDQVP